jgi:MFS transporter, ACS family, allantoate permease
MCAVYIVAFMEKATLNFANAFNLRKDLAIEGYQYSWIVSAAALGLMVGAYPFSLAIQKYSLGKIMTGLIVRLLQADVGPPRLQRLLCILIPC